MATDDLPGDVVTFINGASALELAALTERVRARRVELQQLDAGWDQETTDRLEFYWTKTRRSGTEIGRLVGKTKNACVGKARRMGWEKLT